MPVALRGPMPPGETLEPLAADFRRGRDGEQLGLLKLVAGILGVGLDELIQRDANRRLQRVMAVTARRWSHAIDGCVDYTWMNARAEAERQRSAAEGLVEFMLTDLRTGLKGVGRLDIMAAVNSMRCAITRTVSTRCRCLRSNGGRASCAPWARMTKPAATTAQPAKFEEVLRTTAALLDDRPMIRSGFLTRRRPILDRQGDFQPLSRPPRRLQRYKRLRIGWCDRAGNPHIGAKSASPKAICARAGRSRPNFRPPRCYSGAPRDRGGSTPPGSGDRPDMST